MKLVTNQRKASDKSMCGFWIIHTLCSFWKIYFLFGKSRIQFLINPYAASKSPHKDFDNIHIQPRVAKTNAKSCKELQKGVELMLVKLDGVGPVDNRPSTFKLHHFVQKKKKKEEEEKIWHLTFDMWHVTCNTWHVTHDMWHMTRDMFGGVNILSKFQLPSSYGLWFMILWRSGGKGWLSKSVNQWITRLFIEQPRLHRVC